MRAVPGNTVECLDLLIADALAEFKRVQQPDGHWMFALEANVTIPAEYVLLQHFLGEPDAATERNIAPYIRATQGDHGGWPLFHGGDFDMSASVKAYYALKLIGDKPGAPHMARARRAILDRGGPAKANVFTRIVLALFCQLPWRAVPVMPVEIMLLPRWSPFHLSKVSYWSRTVIVPLLILMALKPRAKNPRNVDIDELFPTPPGKERLYLRNPLGSVLVSLPLGVDRALRLAEPHFPEASRRRAIAAAVSFVTERLNGEDGLGAIFPAMVNAVMAFAALGYKNDDSDFVQAKRAVDRLLRLEEPEEEIDRARDAGGYCQPCFSPVWDTALAAHAIMEAGESPDGSALRRSLDWLVDRQILECSGDWAVRRPGLRPGGWAFQYRNDHYPDVDDTAVVAMALHRAGDPRYRAAIDRAGEWVLGMQSRNGGWGAFDADNTHYHLNHIPFADHGALLDPPTADVSARCVSMLVQLGYHRTHRAVARGLNYLRREQEPDGSWFGRWGTNYIYGTWSVLCALNAAREDAGSPAVRKSVDWLLSRQRADGGWGEDGATYWRERKGAVKESTPSQTAWAVLGLMAAGEIQNPAVRHGIEYLELAPRTGVRWDEPWHTAVGFPCVFYLKYHGYSAYFPLWAISRYRSMIVGNTHSVAFGM